MVRRLGRKGTSMEEKSYFILWEMLIFVLVIFVIMFSVRAIVTGSSYWKKYYSADLALIADLENTNQGDFVINYELKDQERLKFFSFIFSPILTILDEMPEHSFEFELKEDSIAVYGASEDALKNPRSYPFAKASRVEVEEKLLMADFLVLSKKGSLLQLTHSDYDMNTCPSYDTSKDISKLKLTATSSGKNPIPKKYAQSTAQLFRTYAASNDLKKELTLIITHNEKNNMTIYYLNDKNIIRAEKFSCILKQEYSKQFFTEGLESRPYDGSLDNDAEFKKLLAAKDPDEMFIIISLTGTDISKDQDESATFVAVMSSTLEKYYGLNP